MPLNPLLSWLDLVSHCSQRDDIFSTVVASDVVQISPGSLILLFSLAFVVPSFPALLKHDLVVDPVGFGISIRVIIRLIV